MSCKELCCCEDCEKLERAEKRNAVLVQQLARATGILKDVHLISPGQPGHGDLSREQRTLAEVERFIKEVRDEKIKKFVELS